MSAIPLPEGSNAAEMIRRLRAIDAEFFGTVYAKYLVAVGANITDLVASEITVGQIVGDQITDGTITTSKLVVGSFDNLISNPGFESGSTTPHYTGEAPGSSWVLRGNATDGHPPRSGAYQIEVRHDTLSTSAYLHLNGWVGGISGHFEVHRGDVIYAECYTRGEGTDVTNGLMEIQWLKADSSIASGSAQGTLIPIPIHATNFVKLTVSGAAPIDAVYAVVRVRILSSSGGASYVAVNDLYCRRMVGTTIIEDGAITADKLTVTSLDAITASMGTLTVDSILTMGAGGVFRTAASGNRVELNESSGNRLAFYSGHASETFPGVLRLTGGGTPIMSLLAPTVTGVRSWLNLFGDDLTLNGKEGSISLGLGGMALQHTSGVTITQESWATPSLQNGWVNYGSGEQTMRYRKDSNGTVWLQGVIKFGTTTSGTLILTLPAGYRPGLTLNLTGLANNALCNFKMQSNGQLVTRAGWAANFTAINISFPAA